jgi:hypothetical protein
MFSQLDVGERLEFASFDDLLAFSNGMPTKEPVVRNSWSDTIE